MPLVLSGAAKLDTPRENHAPALRDAPAPDTFCRPSFVPSSFPRRPPWFNSRDRAAFTLLELLITISLIAIALGLLVPAIGPASARTIEGAARQFVSDLENARQIAIAERTKTRVLIAAANAPSFGTDLSLRGYTIVSFNKAAGTWKQRGKWTRLPQPAAFEPNPYLGSTEENVIGDRKTTVTPIDNSASGSAATKNFTGAYLEYRANGSTSLDPTSKLQILEIADGIPDASGSMRRKNAALQYRVTIDPLTGSARIK